MPKISFVHRLVVLKVSQILCKWQIALQYRWVQTVFSHWYKGTTIDHLGGGSEIEKKNFGDPSSGKKKFRKHSPGENIFLEATIQEEKNFWEAFLKKKITEGVPGEKNLFWKFPPAPPPQIINGRPLRGLGSPPPTILTKIQRCNL